MRHLLWASFGYFKESPGLDIIFNFTDDLESSIKGDAEIDIEANEYFADAFIGLAKKVCEKKGCRVLSVKRTAKRGFFEPFYSNPFVFRNVIRARIRMRHALGILRRMLGKADQSKADVLMLTNIRFAKSAPDDNILFGNISKKLREKNISCKELLYEEIVETAPIKRFIREYLFRKESYMGDYYTHKHFLRNNHDFICVRRRWNKIKDDPSFKGIFSYRGYDFYELIKPKLELIFSALAYIAYDAKNIAAQIAKREDYRVLLIDHEENIYGKGFMLVNQFSKEKKTVAIAHELIYPGCYHTHIKNKAVLDRKSPLWRPLPDVKCVWGEYSKKILTESCNYDPAIIRVTGYPKFDQIKQVYNQDQLIKKYGLDKKRKKILIASEAMGHLYKQYLKLAKELPEVDFVFKPHYYEEMETVRALLRRRTSNMKIVDKFTDIYELINACDYTLVFCSTVGFESMIFDKPVFIFDPDDTRLEYLPYLSSRAAINVRSAAELRVALKKMENKAFVSKLKADRAELVRRMSYKNDGKAAERVADEIVKLIK